MIILRLQGRSIGDQLAVGEKKAGRCRRNVTGVHEPAIPLVAAPFQPFRADVATAGHPVLVSSCRIDRHHKKGKESQAETSNAHDLLRVCGSRFPMSYAEELGSNVERGAGIGRAGLAVGGSR
jgi:hypothetical protein